MQTPQIHLSDKKSINSPETTFTPQITPIVTYQIGANTYVVNNTDQPIEYNNRYLVIPDKNEMRCKNVKLYPNEWGYLGGSNTSDERIIWDSTIPNMIRITYYSRFYGNKMTYFKLNPKYFELKKI